MCPRELLLPSTSQLESAAGLTQPPAAGSRGGPTPKPERVPGGEQDGSQEPAEEGEDHIDREREHDHSEHLRVHHEAPWLARAGEPVAETHRPQSDDVRTVKPVAVAITVALPPG